MSSPLYLDALSSSLEGELRTDLLHKALYATDASVYRTLPVGVAIPKNVTDLHKIVAFAGKHSISIIPRTAGTSLAGQCVGEGLVVDLSRHFTKILEIDPENKTVTVEPGVIRDELNADLKPYGLFFAPNTSTSNRCMLGGMLGNNSSGSTSIKYGVTRDKILEVDMILSDGSNVTFKSLSPAEVSAKATLDSLEGDIYRLLLSELIKPEVQLEIRQWYPKPEIHRRNNGYAVDKLLDMQPFSPEGESLNLAKLIAGSEGTLGMVTRLKFALDDLPPSQGVMVAAHYSSIAACCDSVYDLMQHDLFTCEMMDKVILDCTKNNKGQLPNRFFIDGDPEAILMLELRAEDEETLEIKRKELILTLEKGKLAYAWPSLYGEDIDKALELRKAGLGLLGNIVGDKKAVACIEDTAVSIRDLSPYIREFSALMEGFGQKAVYYAHAGAGELHLRPILDLKKKADVGLFREITTAVAQLVKKYGGAMSGEHGDGRVRSEFIEFMIGPNNYALLQKIKNTFDPNHLFNPGKITNPVTMDTALRYEAERAEPEIQTFLDFSDSQGILRAAEKCNGSGDCRKTERAAGAMCPSFHATRNEKDTTRGRANALREFLTTSEASNKFAHPELKEVFDLCLSCKACGNECPSNVDVATLKAEFLHQYYKFHPPTLRDRAFAFNTRLNQWASLLPSLSNSSLAGGLIKKILGIAPKRTLPKIRKISFTNWLEGEQKKYAGRRNGKAVLLFIDEFTQYLDGETGKDAISLLSALGYEIIICSGDSGRAALSKGFLHEAHKAATQTLENLMCFDSSIPILGIEPSAILSFRDEYQRMNLPIESAESIGKRSFLIEEFLANEMKNGTISRSMFTRNPKKIKIHVHCHQKSLSNTKCTFDVLNFPENYQVTLINAGCCGMAGSFGYEEEHYDISMRIGEQRLFPAVRRAGANTVVVANGTSCRHQILDGTSVHAVHPVTALLQAVSLH